MAVYDPTAYGAAIADVYDELYDDDFFDTVGAVSALAALAGSGPVLELGIGTGRLALPLAAQGLTVHGIDASETMLEQLHMKRGGPDIPVTCADFCDFELAERFSLAVLAINTVARPPVGHFASPS